jgi:hypothetical protein
MAELAGLIIDESEGSSPESVAGTNLMIDHTHIIESKFTNNFLPVHLCIDEIGNRIEVSFYPVSQVGFYSYPSWNTANPQLSLRVFLNLIQELLNLIQNLIQNTSK